MSFKLSQVAGVSGATELLREDHRKVKELYREFENAGVDRKKALGRQIITELEIHSVIEEDLFYPAARRAIQHDELIAESQESHHVMKVLIAELRMLPMGRTFVAKFGILMNNVKHHMREEENDLFPRVERSDVDLQELGEEMFNLKQRLLKGGALSKGLIFADEMTAKTGSVGLGALLAVGAAVVLLARVVGGKKSNRKEPDFTDIQR
jgi:hypothetical protein